MPTIDQITQTGLQVLKNAGLPDEYAETQLSLLLEAELRGVPSHGLLRLPRIVQRIRNGVCNPLTKGSGVWRDTAFYQVEGDNGLGPIVALDALANIGEKARDTGIAVAAIRNCDHLGMLAWYAEKVANGGQILIALTISEALVHPWGGNRAMLGTNPIAIGIPAKPEPFVFDMATSLVSMGKIHDHANRGASIPEGWAVDAQGQPTTDAAAAKLGAIAPFGGPKGYGLALAFELLVAALSGSAVGRDVVGTLDSEYPCNKGDVFIVLEPASGTGEAVSGFMQALRESPASDPDAPVRIPGDRAQQERARNLERNIALDSGVWSQIEALAKQIDAR